MIDNRNFQNVFQQSAALSHHREEPLFYFLKFFFLTANLLYLQLSYIKILKIKMTFHCNSKNMDLFIPIATFEKVISKLLYNNIFNSKMK